MSSASSLGSRTSSLDLLLAAGDVLLAVGSTLVGLGEGSLVECVFADKLVGPSSRVSRSDLTP